MWDCGMSVGTSHVAACGCALCVDHQLQHEKGLALAGYGIPNGGVGDALVGGKIWATKTLTYGFPADAGVYDPSSDTNDAHYGDGETLDGFAPLSAVQVIAAEAALTQIAAVSQLEFVRDDKTADIRIAQSNVPPSAWAYYPDNDPEGGDAWFGRASGYYDDPARGSYGWHAFLHELGHSVGLKHGHDHGVIGSGSALSMDRDTMEWSVMTYRSYVGDPMEAGYSNESSGYAQSLMRADIAALQQLYGANYDHMSGDTHYSWNPITGEMLIDGAGQGVPVSNRIFETIWDGGGVDLIDASAYWTAVSIDLSPGAGATFASDQLVWLNQKDAAGDAIHASANVYFALLHEGDIRGIFENATGGGGDDTLSGNRAQNTLSGGAGDDVLAGAGAADSLKGGAGNDLLQGGSGRDRLVGQSGDDVLVGDGGRDRLSGGAGRDQLSGGHGRDKLVGGGGADQLNGGLGADNLIGGAGMDVFLFDERSGDDRILDFNTGRDLIDVSQLATGFDDLTMIDTAQGVRVLMDGASVLLVGTDITEVAIEQFIF